MTEKSFDEPQQSDLFRDHEALKEATQVQRFLNWLIDNLFLSSVISFVTWQWCIELLFRVVPNYMMSVANGKNPYVAMPVVYMISALHAVVYYTIAEKTFNGYTLGKIVTGTRAIRTDGEDLTITDALLRSTARIVPLEVFSGLANELWHDRWTKTMVIKTRKE